MKHQTQKAGEKKKTNTQPFFFSMGTTLGIFFNLKVGVGSYETIFTMRKTNLKCSLLVRDQADLGYWRCRGLHKLSSANDEFSSCFPPAKLRYEYSCFPLCFICLGCGHFCTESASYNCQGLCLPQPHSSSNVKHIIIVWHFWNSYCLYINYLREPALTEAQ